MTKRYFLFGNPRPVPQPKVKFLRLERYHPDMERPAGPRNGWALLIPVAGPSWVEREGLALHPEWEEESRAQSIAEVWCYWWNPNQWSFRLPWRCSWLRLRLERNWDYRGVVMLFGYTLWVRPKQPRRRRISRREMREWLKREKLKRTFD